MQQGDVVLLLLFLLVAVAGVTTQGHPRRSMRFAGWAVMGLATAFWLWYVSQ